MRQECKRALMIASLLVSCLILIWFSLKSTYSVKAQERGPILIVGSVFDAQKVPVKGALVELLDSSGHIYDEAITQPNGQFALVAPPITPDELIAHISRAHFKDIDLPLSPVNMQDLRDRENVVLSDITLPREINIAFWMATAVFLGILVLIATGKLHNTLAALVGVSLLLFISYLGRPINENLYIYDFQISLSYIDWNVIFLIMGMMIVIAVVENTGIFQWMSLMAYRITRGRILLLLTTLMLITGIASAFLDNVTTMLLMAPISIQIAIALGISPLAFIIPEVFASNVIGISTLIGTPTNILIGSYANITFTDFLINLTPGVLMAFVGLVIYSVFAYRKDLSNSQKLSPMLIEHLSSRARITEPEHLKKAAWIGFGMFLLFIFGEHIHLIPAVTAIIGATALLVWIRPNIDEMIEAVDWTTLVFFMGLFMVVGAIQEVGLISLVAEIIGRLVGDSLILAMLMIVWLSALLSTVVANIPFTAAMLPVVGFLTLTVPGAESKVLFFCLSVGSALGGNGSLIGASANMVTAGIAERSGNPITYMYFFKKGFPALLITVCLATLWLLFRFL